VREVAEPVDHRVEEGNGDPRALAGPFPANERGDGRHRRVAPSADVADRDADPGGLLGGAGQRDETRLPLHHEIVRVALRVGPVRAVTRDLRVYDIGSEGADARLVQPNPLGPPRGEVLEEDVAVGDESFERGPRPGILHVQRHALLAAVHPDEAARQAPGQGVPAAGDVALAGRLDLYDLRAEVGEKPRAERPGEANLTSQYAGAL